MQKPFFILTLLIIVVVVIIYLIINGLKQPEANSNKNPTNGPSDSTTNQPINSFESANFKFPVEMVIKSFSKYGEAQCSHCEFKINGDMHDNSPIFTEPNRHEYMQPKLEAPIKKNPTNGQSNSTTNEPTNSFESANSILPVKTKTKSFDKFSEAQCSHCEIKVNGDMHDHSPIFTEPNQHEYMQPNSKGGIALRSGQWVRLVCADGFAEPFDGQILLLQYIDDKHFLIKNPIINFSNIFLNFLIKNKIVNLSNKLSKFLIKNKIANFTNKFSNFIIKNKVVNFSNKFSNILLKKEIVNFSHKFSNFLIKNKKVNFSNQFSNFLIKKEIVNFSKIFLNFFIKNRIVNFSKIICKTMSMPTPMRTGLRCSGEDTELINIGIGIEFNGSWVTLLTMQVCFDNIRQTTLYVEHKITPASVHYKQHVNTKNFTSGDFFGGRNIDAFYKKSKQIKALSRTLGKNASIYVTAKNFLSRGHLVAKTDLIFSGQQKGTFHHLNVMPQWESFNAGNWVRIENGVRQFAHDNDSTLLCWTGTWGVCTLPDENNIQRELYLGDNNNVIPVPKLFYRIVIDAVSRKGITFVGVNNPYLTNEELTTGTYLVAEDVSHNINWTDWDRQNIEKGYCYACSVPDFVAVVKGLPLDKLETSGILGLKELSI